MAREFSNVDYITFGDIPAIDDATVLSISSLVWNDNTTQDHAVIATLESGVDQGFMLWTDDVAGVSGRTNTYAWYVQESPGAGGTSARLEGATDAAVANAWQHVFVSFQANTAGGMQLWVGGAEDANSPINTTNIDNAGSVNNAVLLGSRYPLLDKARDGRLAEVGIWNRVLTDSEIVSLSKGFSPLFYPNGLIFYAPLIGTPRIEPDATANSGVKATVSNYSFNHTVSAGDNRILIVNVGARGASSTNIAISGITYGGVALTKATSGFYNGGSDAANASAEQWYLVAPAVGTGSISITYTGTVSHSAATSISAFNVNQTSPLNVSGNGNGTASNPSVAVTTTVNNCFVVDSVYDKYGLDLTIGAGQTLIESQLGVNGGGDRYASSYERKGVAGSVTMSWSGNNEDWASAVGAYAPINRFEPEIARGFTGTLSNTNKVTHPRMIYPTIIDIRKFTTAVAASIRRYGLPILGVS